ncbi:MAG: iron-sulfur cluster assembly accessory protein [Nanoarchaeota archaeon]|nr:iron-sulfur cluster assembly accessory protein [Nanoarchaeota archaeon]
MGSLILTEEAALQMKSLCEKNAILPREGAYELRFGVAAGGCAGFQYVLEPYESPLEGDSEFFFSDLGVRIYVGEKSFQFLQGTRIDYRQDFLGSSFMYENPNMQESCGCQTSFSPKKCC